MNEDELKGLAEAPDSRRWTRQGSKTEVLLVRHGQFDGPEGLDSSPLSDVGLAQSQALAAFLASWKLVAVYSSPALRALQTAAVIAEKHDLPVRRHQGIREIDLRGPPGSTLAGLVGEAESERLMGVFQVKKVWDLFGGLYETSAEFRTRVTEAVESIAAAHPGEAIVLVTHSPVIQAYLAVLSGAAFDLPFRTRQTSISLVEFHGDDRQIHAVGARPHLHNF